MDEGCVTMICPACGFWKLNEFMNRKKCKKCGYEYKTLEQLEDEKTK